jgi:hypothetical protein
MEGCQVQRTRSPIATDNLQVGTQPPDYPGAGSVAAADHVNGVNTGRAALVVPSGPGDHFCNQTDGARGRANASAPDSNQFARLHYIPRQCERGQQSLPR